MEEMRAYKGLEAHNQFTSGWVKDVEVAHPTNNISVVKGRSIRQAATRPWIIAENSGKVVSANCDCKAGLGGTCTHVSALLFMVEASVRIRGTKTVTQEKAYWLLPSSISTVPFAPVSDIDFTSASRKRQLLDSAISSVSDENSNQQFPTPTFPVAKRKIPPPTESEIAFFFITSPYNEDYVPLSLQKGFPKPLTELRSDRFLQMSHEELIGECKKIEVTITQGEADVIEQHTKSQADCKLWFRYRSGRVTASRMKAVCHTKISKPSASLVKAICYPEIAKFQTKATAYGCQHEKKAREEYSAHMFFNHDNFTVEESGLVINPAFPHIGASPDGIINCNCCGRGVLEVKCPFCVKESTAEEHECLVSDKESGKETFRLSKRHQYYYQVQTQLFVCQTEYCDFLVCTEKNFHLERITPDAEFWKSVEKQATNFFRNVVLLELTGQFYSR
ncbi:hypothetical protein HOLleu_44819 [Holothuria leucospilota]|uniref:SWIM-type domain-containing protein n=1 Tax=Holothuria leucospilota TaxID=206669 RepID=A0A9Q0Y8K6_HOLLE|nr:hypothetical protein HOLleu_44819 [Holothuria leucospilota]